MAGETENLVLELLRGMRADFAGMRSHMATSADLGELSSDFQSHRADFASDIVTMQARSDAEHKSTREQIVGVRRAVTEYHSAVVGRGILISELEARIRRMQQPLNLPTVDAY